MLLLLLLLLLSLSWYIYMWMDGWMDAYIQVRLSLMEVINTHNVKKI